MSQLGFKSGGGGVHLARTMMLEELRSLLAHVSEPDALRDRYVRAIEEENCLGKRSRKTRELTVRHLIDLYSLDPSVAVFQGLRYFWSRDQEGRPLLAVLCAYARDPIVQMSAPYILSFDEGEVISQEGLGEYIDRQDPHRFSRATLKSTAQNLNSSWTQSGHLVGRARKRRSRARATPGAAAYALFLGYLTGARGGSLFQTEYSKILDCSNEQAAELAEIASRYGWIVFNRIGDIMEPLFPGLIIEPTR